jgi:tetratricopeptide (TPR) repeat protein
MPKIMARVPPKARLWVDDYASMPLSNRRWLKITQWGPGEPYGFDNKLFKPDYVLIDAVFAIRARPPYRERMLTFLAKNHYRKIAEDGSVVLIEAPEPAAEPELVPEWIHLPEADESAAKEYGRYLATPLNGKGILIEEALDTENEKGLAAAKQGLWEIAVRHYEEILAIYPDYYRAHSNLGVALSRLGKTAEADRHLREAIQLQPNLPSVYYYYGKFLTAQDRLPDGAGNFKGL